MKKKILGSAISTLGGWVAGWVCLFIIFFFGNRQYRYNDVPRAIWDDLGGFLLMGVFVVPAWLVVVAPLYSAMPRKSYFWKWFICVPFGALSGVAILLSPVAYREVVVYHATFSDVISTWPLSLPAAVVGAVTALVGTLTLDHFRPEQRVR